MTRLFHGVILDIDGTLVDSNDAHAQAWVEAFASEGVKVTFEAVRRLIGMGGDKLAPEVSGISESSPHGKKISEKRKEIFKSRYLPTLKAFPNAQELLVRMKEDGKRLVVASSAKKEELQELLRLCGADELIEGKTSSDDADNSKPDPDIVQAALDNLVMPAAQVVMLGDTPYDIEAAKKAGVGMIAFRCGGWRDSDLDGALAIYQDPADLLAHYMASPLAWNGSAMAGQTA